MDRLGSPHEHYPVIHIAGTSGKTSTAYFVRQILEAAGLKTGLTVSPHVESITERVQIAGRPVSGATFVHTLNQLEDRLGDQLGGLSYFESLMALSFTCFANASVDVAIVETGLGGRLDASNVTRQSSKLCVITDVGLDHTEILGPTISDIAREKAGIIWPGNHVMLHQQPEDVLTAVRHRAKHVGASVEVLPTSAYPEPVMDRNFSLARAAAANFCARTGIEELQAPPPPILPPGRFELIEVGDKRVLVDGAHNPQKLQALLGYLRASGVARTTVLCNMTEAPLGKIRASLAVLGEFCHELVVGPFGGAQDIAKSAMDVERFAATASACGIERITAFASLPEALTYLLASRDEIVVITGSLYLVSDARRELAHPATRAVRHRTPASLHPNALPSKRVPNATPSL